MKCGSIHSVVRWAIAGWAGVASGAPTTGADGAGTLQLARAGGTDYAIVVAADALPAERKAAEELQSHLARISGAEFPLQDERSWNGPAIHVRISRRAGDLLEGVPETTLDEEEVLWQTLHRDLILAGGGPRGVLYAVHLFLEEQLGCRWYGIAYGSNPECSVIPERSTLSVPTLKERRKPAFRYRQIHCAGHMGNGHWDVRHGLNGALERPDRPEEYGGDFLIRGVHNSCDLLRFDERIEDTPDRMFAERPELFADAGGHRVKVQVCATHPDLPALLAPRIRTQHEKYRPARIGLSQMDGGGACRCERCLEANRRAGGEDVYAGSWLTLVNETAARLPDLDLWTFAYLWTRAPPQGIRPRDNVYIWYCLSGIDHELSTDLDARYAELAAWGKLAPRHIFVWTYDFINNQVEFGYQPSLFVAGRRLRRFHSMGVEGVFIQAGESWSTGASFAELQYYVLSRLLWDPYRDEDQIVDEFMNAYYGAAAPYLSAYRELNRALFLLHDPETNTELRAGQSGIYAAIGDGNVARLEDLLIRAEAAAGDNVVRMRVKMLRLPIWHYRLMMAGRSEWMAQSYEDRNRTRRWYADEKEITATVDRLMESDAHLDTIREYVTTLSWGDVRGFRESPIQDWRDALQIALRERGIEAP